MSRARAAKRPTARKSAGYVPPSAPPARVRALARRVLDGDRGGEGLSIAIVASRFNDDVGNRLLEGAVEALAECGVRSEDVLVVRVPGAFEIPVAAAWLARSGRHDAVVGIGAVIRGETPHFDYVAGEAARGIARVSTETGVPVIFGVLTTDTLDQALARAGGRLGNRGADAARSAVDMARLARALRDGKVAP